MENIEKRGPGIGIGIHINDGTYRCFICGMY